MPASLGHCVEQVGPQFVGQCPQLRAGQRTQVCRAVDGIEQRSHHGEDLLMPAIDQHVGQRVQGICIVTAPVLRRINHRKAGKSTCQEFLCVLP